MRSSSLGAEGETVEVQGTMAAGSASSSDPEPLAGHSPLPSAPDSRETVGAVRYPAPRDSLTSPWTTFSRLTPTGPAGCFERGNGRGPTPSKGAVGPSRGAVALAAATPYRDRHRRLAGPPEHRPTPALQLSAASSPCLARPALSHRGSARRRCPPPLRGAGCRGTAGGQTGSGGRHVVGIAVRAGRPAAVNWKRTRRHQGGNKLAGQAHTTGEVTESVTGYRVSR